MRIFDVHQAAKGRGMLSIYIHDGHYYLLPPPGMTSHELEALLNEYKDRGVIHFTFNAQSSIDTPHKPVLPMDDFVNEHFSDPPAGIVKVTAVSKSKLADLNELIYELKPAFDPKAFPYVNDIQRTDYRPPAEGTMTRLSIKLKSGDWKHLRDLEEAIRNHLAENNLIRDITVGRHSVKGMDPEIMLSSTEEATDKGQAFLAALAEYLPGDEIRVPVAQQGAEGLLAALSSAEEEHYQNGRNLRRQPVIPIMSPLEQRRLALSSIGDTLKNMEGFRGLPQSMTGNMLLIQFPKGILGLGGHFDTEHEGSLATVHRTSRSNPRLETGWTAHYHYDRRSRVLSITATGEGEAAPPGWSTLY